MLKRPRDLQGSQVGKAELKEGSRGGGRVLCQGKDALGIEKPTWSVSVLLKACRVEWSSRRKAYCR